MTGPSFNKEGFSCLATLGTQRRGQLLGFKLFEYNIFNRGLFD